MKNLFRRSIAMLLMLAMLSGLIGPGNVMLLTAYAEEESVETLELPTDVPEMEEIPEIVEAPAEPTEDVSLPAEPVQSGEETPAQETAGGSEPETPEESEGETGITENTGEELDENNAEPAALAEGEFWIHPVNAEGAEIETVLLHLTGLFPADAQVLVYAQGLTAVENAVEAYHVSILSGGQPWQPAGDKVQVHMRSDAFLGTSGELNVYHLADAGSAAEYVDSVTASDSWVEFDAASFSAYAISTVLEKTITATDGNTYKITVAYDSASGIPAGAALAVSEITDPAAYRAYLDSAAETLSVSLENLTYTRLFDISVVGPMVRAISPTTLCLSPWS